MKLTSHHIFQTTILNGKNSIRTNEQYMYYHIKLMQANDRGEFKINISEEELLQRYVEPYIYGETIVINGTTLEPKDVWRVKITQSENTLDEIVNEIEQEDSFDRSPYKIFRSSAEWRAMDKVENVTDKFIMTAPGSKKRIKAEKKEITNTDNKKVFIVHGHDIELKNDVELFLKSISLEPIVLHKELDEGLTIIEKFEKHSNVNYAIILLTPDDIGFTVKESAKPESERNIEFRSRQNVIFEFGYFVGKLSRRNVCCIFKEGVAVPSDLNGLIYKKVVKSVEEVGMFLMKEMKNAGLDVKF
jgi:predicted nucleotide-binding protein